MLDDWHLAARRGKAASDATPSSRRGQIAQVPGEGMVVLPGQPDRGRTRALAGIRASEPGISRRAAAIFAAARRGYTAPALSSAVVTKVLALRVGEGKVVGPRPSWGLKDQR